MAKYRKKVLAVWSHCYPHTTAAGLRRPFKRSFLAKGNDSFSNSEDHFKVHRIVPTFIRSLLGRQEGSKGGTTFKWEQEIRFEFCVKVKVVSKYHSLTAQQCDQMARLLFQHQTIYINENLPNWNTKFAKVDAKFCQIACKPSKIFQSFGDFAIVANFRQIWSRCCPDFNLDHFICAVIHSDCKLYSRPGQQAMKYHQQQKTVKHSYQHTFLQCILL